MENKKKDNVKNIIIVILSILLLCSGGYIVYNKITINNNPDKKECSQKIITEESVNITNDSFSITNKNKIQNLSFTVMNTFFDVLISKDGSAFLTVKDNGNNDEKVQNSISHLQSMYELNDIDGYCNSDEYVKELYPNGSKVESIKLNINNVISAYHVRTGQDPYGEYLIFVIEDGILSRINLGKLLLDNSLEIENNIDNLKNIVSVVQSSTTCVPSGAAEILAIEKNGTQHILK